MQYYLTYLLNLSKYIVHTFIYHMSVMHIKELLVGIILLVLFFPFVRLVDMASRGSILGICVLALYLFYCDYSNVCSVPALQSY